MNFLKYLIKPRPARYKIRAATKPRKHAAEVNAEDLFGIWKELQACYFPDRLDLLDYKVLWSRRRQKRVLGSCHIGTKIVRVAKELSNENYREWLEPLLYHEMCHAVIGFEVDKRRGKRQWHGAKFKNLLFRHPKTDLLDRWIKNGGWREAVLSARKNTQVKISQLY